MKIDVTKLISGGFAAVKELDDAEGVDFLEGVRTNFVEVQAQKENLISEKEILSAKITTLESTIAKQEETIASTNTIIESMKIELGKYVEMKKEIEEKVHQDMLAKVQEQIQGLGLNLGEELSVSIKDKSTEELTEMFSTLEGLKPNEALLISTPPVGKTSTKPNEGGHNPGEGKKDFMRKARRK